MIHLSEKDPVDNETMLISGWGALQEKAPSHPILQAAYVQVLNFQRCKQLFIISSLMNSMFCAGKFNSWFSYLIIYIKKIKRRSLVISNHLIFEYDYFLLILSEGFLINT